MDALPGWILRYTEFLRYNDLPDVLGGTGPSDEPESDAGILEGMVEWLNTPVAQLYTELHQLFAEAERRRQFGANIPNMRGWVAFYDDLIKHKR